MKGNFGSHVDQMSQGVPWLWIFKRDYIRSKYIIVFLIENAILTRFGIRSDFDK